MLCYDNAQCIAVAKDEVIIFEYGKQLKIILLLAQGYARFNFV